MTPAYVVQITTPKRVVLNGLWFGPRKPKKLIIILHGLTGSAFSMSRVVNALADTSCAVLTFNGRGFGQINDLTRIRRNKVQYFVGGTAHEIFTECVDDIDGCIHFAKKAGVKEIYIAGHSTGCQKAVYWASKRSDKKVKGLILFGPLSDYSGALATKGKTALDKGVSLARKLITAGKPHQLMPRNLGEWFECDAQRFVSLYTADSSEEIFTYARPSVRPKTLQKTSARILALLAGADEHGDMPAKEIAAWFKKHLPARPGKPKDQVIVVPKVKHSFRGGEKGVANVIHKFMKER